MIRTLTAVSLMFIGVTVESACRDADALARGVSGGDPENGRHLIYAYACGSCHAIPGVAEANGTAGPPLRGLGNRIYIAGTLQNTPENLARWIARPQAVQPGNAMPDAGVTERQARDMAAYLYTLR